MTNLERNRQIASEIVARHNQRKSELTAQGIDTTITITSEDIKQIKARAKEQVINTKTMETVEFKNQELERVVEIAKQNNYKVFAFQHDKPISQIFVVSENNEIGTISESWGGVSYGTIHKPCCQFGTGFGLSDYFASDTASLSMIKACCEVVKPEWASSGEVRKYKSWDEYVSSPINAILKYFEI